MKQTYTVSVEKIQEGVLSESHVPMTTNIRDAASAEACYNIVKEEYVHTFTRSDKLDNKVYIALTFCAFIFLSVLDLMECITEFEYPSDVQRLTMIVLYLILCTFTIGLFLFTLVKLANLLKPMRVRRIDPTFYTQNELQLEDAFTVYTFTFKKYQESIAESNSELEERFKKYNKCISNLVWIVICLFVLSAFKTVL